MPYERLGDDGEWKNATQMVVSGGSIYIATGRLGGCCGGGGLYRVDLSSGEHVEVNDGWANAIQMLVGGDGKIYVVCGKAYHHKVEIEMVDDSGGFNAFGVCEPKIRDEIVNECNGDGSLERIDPATGAYETVGSPNEWGNATQMVECAGSMYIVAGKMGHRDGGGGLYRIDLASGEHAKVSGGWANATQMLVHDGMIYLVCGKLGGCNGDGDLYRIDPATGADEVVGPPKEWGNATQMVECGGSIYIVTGKLGGCNGGGGLYRIDLTSGEHVEVSGGWANTTQMLAHDGMIYLVCGKSNRDYDNYDMKECNGDGDLYRIDPATGADEVVGPPKEWANVCHMLASGDSMYICLGAMGKRNGGGGLYRIPLNSEQGEDRK